MHLDFIACCRVFKESSDHSKSFKMAQYLHVKQKEYENYMGLKKYFTVTKKFPW